MLDREHSHYAGRKEQPAGPGYLARIFPSFIHYYMTKQFKLGLSLVSTFICDEQ